jgi:hypothetical protein
MLNIREICRILLQQYALVFTLNIYVGNIMFCHSVDDSESVPNITWGPKYTYLNMLPGVTFRLQDFIIWTN